MSDAIPVRAAVPIPRPGTNLNARNEEEQLYESQLTEFLEHAVACGLMVDQVARNLVGIDWAMSHARRLVPFELICAAASLATLVSERDTLPSENLLHKCTMYRMAGALASPEEITERANALFARMRQIKITPSKDVAEALRFLSWLRRELVIVPAAAQMFQEVTNGTRSVEEATQAIEKLSQSASIVRQRSNPFDLAAAFSGEAMSTGLPWLDEVFGDDRGLIRGSGYTCIATTGGGKTTLAIQLALSLCKQGRKVMLVTTEQTFRERKMVDRYWSALSGVPMRLLAGWTGQGDYPDTLITPDQKATAAKILENLHSFDYAATPGTMTELSTSIAQVQPDVVILDWVGTMARALYQAGVWPDIHTSTQNVANELVSMCNKAGCAAFMLHQIAAAKGTNPHGQYNHTDAADCRSLSVNCAYGLVMTPPDDNKVFSLFASKTRYSTSVRKMLRLDPSGVCRILPIDGPVRRGKGVWVVGEAGTIPAATAPRPTTSTCGFDAKP